MIAAITGANGMLGRTLVKCFSNPAHKIIIKPFTREDFDITDQKNTIDAISSSGADILINCAGYTNVDKAEDEPELANSVNADGAGNVAKACALAGTRLIHISTDYVFNGKKGEPYEESDPPSPVGAYAVSKSLGEQEVFKHNKNSLIIRAQWLYGDGGKNFVTAIINKADEGNKLYVVDDQYGSPTFVDDLAESIRDLLDLKTEGIMHVANRGYCSWHEFAMEIIKLSKMENVIVEPVGSDYYKTKARRPSDSRLDTTFYEKTTGEKLRHWKEALADFMDSKKNY